MIMIIITVFHFRQNILMHENVYLICLNVTVTMVFENVLNLKGGVFECGSQEVLLIHGSFSK